MLTVQGKDQALKFQYRGSSSSSWSL